MRLRKCTIVLAATAVTAGFGVTSSAFAQDHNCNKTYLCTYMGANYTGAITPLTQGTDVPDTNYGSTENFLKARSAYNTDSAELYGHCVIIYSEKNFKGQSYKLRPHTGVRSLPRASAWRNGRETKSGFYEGIRSVQWVTC